jgi:hypothetical protein
MASTKTSGRFSRYPAVNRDVPSGTAPATSNPVAEAAPAAPAAADSTPALDDLTTAEVLAWVDGDEERAAKAYAIESDGKARKSLLDALSKIVG